MPYPRSLRPAIQSALPNDRAELARLLPLWPSELADTSLIGRRRIVALLRRAVRAERQLGRAGHWSYDLARHAALLRHLKREAAGLTGV